MAFQMTEEESFEIDTELDWLLVEAILTSRERNNANPQTNKNI